MQAQPTDSPIKCTKEMMSAMYETKKYAINVWM